MSIDWDGENWFASDLVFSFFFDGATVDQYVNDRVGFKLQRIMGALANPNPGRGVRDICTLPRGPNQGVDNLGSFNPSLNDVLRNQCHRVYLKCICKRKFVGRLGDGFSHGRSRPPYSAWSPGTIDPKSGNRRARS